MVLLLGIQSHYYFFYFCSLTDLLQLLNEKPTSRRLVAALIVRTFFLLFLDNSVSVFRLKNSLEACQ